MTQVFYFSSQACGAYGGGRSRGRGTDGYFARYPRLRGHILDDQDRLRLHVAIFVDGVDVRRDTLSYPIKPESELHVLQALSGA
jgi:hypothetical protein